MKKNHRFILRSTMLAATAFFWCANAQSAITCSLSSNGFSSAYVPANPGTNITAASFTMMCTRASGDASSQAYTVSVNNGQNQNRAKSGTNFISYDLYTDNLCTALWKNKSIGGTVIFGTGLTASQDMPFWGCIPAGQTAAPAGTYVDTVTMNPSIGSFASIPVSIVTPSSCTVTTPPGNINFSYSGFQATDASASTAFAATCTSQLPYSLALDATSGVLAGVSYTLSLSATSNVGNGFAQPYTINGTMAAGQSGACTTSGCSATQARTLTIIY